LDLLLSGSPSSQRQALQLQCLGLDEAPESDYTNDDAKHVDDVVAISGDVASSTSVDADMAVVLESAGEGLSDQIALEVGRWDRGGCACCSSEHVDKLQDEEARECAAKVANTAMLLVCGLRWRIEARLTWREESCRYRQYGDQQSLRGKR
jgi:hypothetical protein